MSFSRWLESESRNENKGLDTHSRDSSPWLVLKSNLLGPSRGGGKTYHQCWKRIFLITRERRGYVLKISLGNEWLTIRDGSDEVTVGWSRHGFNTVIAIPPGQHSRLYLLCLLMLPKKIFPLPSWSHNTVVPKNIRGPREAAAWPINAMVCT